LPEKQYAGRFSEDFVEARRNDLERYLNRVVRHPIARYAEVVNFFLSCDSEIVSLLLPSCRSDSYDVNGLIFCYLYLGMEETATVSPQLTTCRTPILCASVPSRI
jgi:hypothetical protein